MNCARSVREGCAEDEAAARLCRRAVAKAATRRQATASCGTRRVGRVLFISGLEGLDTSPGALVPNCEELSQRLFQLLRGLRQLLLQRFHLLGDILQLALGQHSCLRHSCTCAVRSALPIAAPIFFAAFVSLLFAIFVVSSELHRQYRTRPGNCRSFFLLASTSLCHCLLKCTCWIILCVTGGHGYDFTQEEFIHPVDFNYRSSVSADSSRSRSRRFRCRL